MGANVSLVARNSDNLKDTLNMLEGEGHAVYPFDLKNVENIEEAVKEIILQQGILDGLVHCAGVCTMRPILMTKNDFLHDMMLINFYSFIELIRVISKKKNHSSNTSIVGISSVTANHGLKSLAAYCSSKGAMDASVRALAVELSDKRIRVNNVKPSFVKTKMSTAYSKLTSEEIFNSNVLSRQYMGLGEPIDIANAVAFLLSDASKFITGTGLVVDGGYLS